MMTASQLAKRLFRLSKLRDPNENHTSPTLGCSCRQRNLDLLQVCCRFSKLIFQGPHVILRERVFLPVLLQLLLEVLDLLLQFLVTEILLQLNFVAGSINVSVLFLICFFEDVLHVSGVSSGNSQVGNAGGSILF